MSHDFNEVVEILSDIPGIHELARNPQELLLPAEVVETDAKE